MMEQEWHQECQMLLHPEQPFIDSTKLTLSQPASTCPNVNPLSTGIKIYRSSVGSTSWKMWFPARIQLVFAIH